MTEPGCIVVLNGAPRSGKSSIASAMQDSFDSVWLNVGVDAFDRFVTPPRLRPGIGLRPGGERPDLEPFVPVLYAALYEAVAAQSRLGLNVVVDVGHHDEYSAPLGILGRVAGLLHGLPAFLVGVRCPIEVVMARRNGTASFDGAIPDPILRWQRAVHIPGIYDMEVDTSEHTPEECADSIRRRVAEGRATAFSQIARVHGTG